jgi:hypothetical protein
MLRDYRERHWEEAQRRLGEQAAAAETFGLARLYAIFAARIRLYADEPPIGEWDGVFLARQK